jgi:hypothetical protein
MVARNHLNITFKRNIEVLPVLLFTFIHKFITVKNFSTLPIALTIYVYYFNQFYDVCIERELTPTCKDEFYWAALDKE